MQCDHITKELWSYDEVKVGNTVSDGKLQYKVLNVIEICSPAIQGTHLMVLST